MLFSLASLALASLATASPVVKRQEESSSSMAPTMSSSMSASASSMMSSAMPSGSAAAGGAGSGGSAAYPCPSGFLLSYAIQQATFQVPVDQAVAAVPEWSSEEFPGVEEGEGGNEVGATRTLESGIEQVLIQYTTDEEYVALAWADNLTSGPIDVMDTQISNYTTYYQLYANGSDATTGKAFCLFCAADQEAGIEVVSQTLKYNLGNISEAVASAVGGSMSGSGSASGSMMASASEFSSAAGALSSGVSSAVASATSVASGASASASASA